MKRIHALLIALALAVAVVAGTFAAMRTTQLGTSSTTATQHVSTAEVARQTRILNRAEAALRAQLRRKPPKVPALPAAVTAPAAPAQTVIYHRAPTIVHVLHRHGGEHEGGDSEHGDAAVAAVGRMTSSVARLYTLVVAVLGVLRRLGDGRRAPLGGAHARHRRRPTRAFA